MSRKHKFESSALQYLYDRYVGDNPEQQEIYEEHLGNAQVSRAIYDLRSKAGLTQAALASLIGTTASVISRLENADYKGHSLAMLQRIAAALDRRIEISFLPPRRRAVAVRKSVSRAAPRRVTVRRKTRTG